jgi:hypothetical protein
MWSLKRRATTTAMLLLFSFASITTIMAETNVSWTVYHSWNPQQQFVKRGTINFNPTDISQDSRKDELLQVVNEQPLQPKDVTDMLEYGWYHVKLVPSSSKDEEGAVLGTVPACYLRRSNFKDLFELTLPRSVSDDGQQDHVTSFAYTPLISPLAPKTCEEYSEMEHPASFQSRTNVVLDTPGLPLKPVLSATKPPPGLSFLKRPRAPGKGKSPTEEEYEDPNEQAKPEPPPGVFGFLQKYWYVILPMVLMQFMAAPPEEGPGGGGQPQQQQQQGNDAAAPAVAAAAGASPGKKTARRGKRN